MAIKINGDNSVANPGFTGADTDTGLQVGTNELKLVTGGTAKATVDANGTAKFTGANAPSGLDTRITQYGSLLVGTNSDTVSAARCSIDAGNGNISSNGTGTFNGVVKADRSTSGDGCFHAALNGTVKGAINSNGNAYFLGTLGVGTSSPDYDFQLAKSSAVLAINATNQSSSSTSTLLFRNKDNAGNTGNVGSVAGLTTADGGNGALVFKTASSGSQSEHMRINSSGNVGIGTISPQTKFHSSGTTNGAQATFGISSSGLKISTFQKTNNDAGVILDAQQSSNGTLTFATAGTERMRILSSGGLTFNGDTAQANALDDYEEGTWTPSASGFTTSGTVTTAGKYVKVGRQVTFGLRFKATGTIAYGVSCNISLPFAMTYGETHNGLINMYVNSNSEAQNSNKNGNQCKLDGEGGSRFFVGSFTTTSTNQELLFGGTYIASS